MKIEDKVKLIEKTAQNILDKLKLKGRPKVETDGEVILLNLEVEDEAGRLIGRRGQTLLSMEHLMRLLINSKLNEFTLLSLDINSYRKEQKDKVKKEALSIIKLVKKSGRAKLLSPMPAFERKMVHIIVKEKEGLATQSVGQEPNRRVLIKKEEEKEE